MNEIGEKNVMVLVPRYTSFLHHIHPKWKGDGIQKYRTQSVSQISTLWRASLQIYATCPEVQRFSYIVISIHTLNRRTATKAKRQLQQQWKHGDTRI